MKKENLRAELAELLARYNAIIYPLQDEECWVYAMEVEVAGEGSFVIDSDCIDARELENRCDVRIG